METLILYYSSLPGTYNLADPEGVFSIIFEIFLSWPLAES
jgi:hypothetical protein